MRFEDVDLRIEGLACFPVPPVRSVERLGVLEIEIGLVASTEAALVVVHGEVAGLAEILGE